MISGGVLISPVVAPRVHLVRRAEGQGMSLAGCDRDDVREARDLSRCRAACAPLPHGAVSEQGKAPVPACSDGSDLVEAAGCHRSWPLLGGAVAQLSRAVRAQPIS